MQCKLILVISYFLITHSFAIDKQPYTNFLKSQKNKMGELVDTSERYHKMEDLSFFFMPEFSFKEKTHEEAINLLFEKYRALCVATGEKPLEFTFGDFTAHKKLSYTCRSSSMLSCIKRINIIYGKKTAFNFRENAVLHSSYEDKAKVDIRDVRAIPYAVAPNWGLKNFDSTEEAIVDLKKKFKIEKGNKVRFLSKTSTLLVNTTITKHRMLRDYLMEESRQVPCQFIVSSYLYKVPGDKRIDHTLEDEILIKTLVKNKWDYKKLARILARPGQSATFKELKVDDKTVWEGHKYTFDATLIGFSTHLSGNFVSNKEEHHFQEFSYEINQLWRQKTSASFKLSSTASGDEFLRIKVYLIDAEGKRLTHYLPKRQVER